MNSTDNNGHGTARFSVPEDFNTSTGVVSGSGNASENGSAGVADGRVDANSYATGPQFSIATSGPYEFQSIWNAGWNLTVRDVNSYGSAYIGATADVSIALAVNLFDVNTGAGWSSYFSNDTSVGYNGLNQTISWDLNHSLSVPTTVFLTLGDRYYLQTFVQLSVGAVAFAGANMAFASFSFSSSAVVTKLLEIRLAPLG
ncbi:MAG: hypothetical protein L3K19_03405 [Thermoplasmata archaeon]|nr:hypothetical protein [Thermoplasmata archaeon]